MQRFDAYFKVILILAALHKHSDIISVRFGGVRYFF